MISVFYVEDNREHLSSVLRVLENRYFCGTFNKIAELDFWRKNAERLFFTFISKKFGGISLFKDNALNNFSGYDFCWLAIDFQEYINRCYSSFNNKNNIFEEIIL